MNLGDLTSLPVVIDARVLDDAAAAFLPPPDPESETR